MSRHPKAPPRFIPTLTEVVPLPREPVVPPPPPPAPRERPAAVASSAPAGPPPWLLDIPTLADSIEASFAAQTAPTPPHSAAEPFQATALPGSLSAEQEARLVQRLLQRVEASLEHRLREAIDHIVQEQAALILPKLRTEVRTLVRQTVGEAVAQEWINARTPGRQEVPPPLSGASARPLD